MVSDLAAHLGVERGAVQHDQHAVLALACLVGGDGIGQLFAVRQGDEADVLGVADVLCPAAYGDDRTIGGGVLVQRNDLSAFHSFSPYRFYKRKRQLFSLKVQGEQAVL